MMYWFFDLSEDIANEVQDRIYDADATLGVRVKRFIDGHVTPGCEATLGGLGIARTSSVGPQEGVNPGSTFADRCLNTGAMGVRARGLDIKAGAAKLKARPRRACRGRSSLSTAGIGALPVSSMNLERFLRERAAR
jgi:hypothetical protein